MATIGLFVFECLLEIIETLAKGRGLDTHDLVRDLYGRLK